MNVLFVCTGNSCRSQMAEGWLRHLAAGRVAVRSAGLEAHGLNPRAVAAMAAVGIDIGAQCSTELEAADLDWADLVITVCGDADARCPVLPAGVAKQHWPIEDPARASGSAAEVEGTFATVRDELRRRIEGLLGELGGARRV